MTPAGSPDLVPGVPVTWEPTALAFALSSLMLTCGELPHGMLDELLEPYAVSRLGPGHRKFLAACPGCGTRRERLVLTPDVRWRCQRCAGESQRHVMWIAAALQFCLRIGFRGRYPVLLHRAVSQRVVRTLRRISRAEQLQLTLTLSRVLGENPRKPARHRPGAFAVGHGYTFACAYLEHVASPAAYAARCAAELGLELPRSGKLAGS